MSSSMKGRCRRPKLPLYESTPPTRCKSLFQQLASPNDRPRKQQAVSVKIASSFSSEDQPGIGHRLGDFSLTESSQECGGNTSGRTSLAERLKAQRNVNMAQQKAFGGKLSFVSSQELSLSEGDYMTPSDQPVHARTDQQLKEQVQNQRQYHQSRTGQDGVNALAGNVELSLPANRFLPCNSSSTVLEARKPPLNSSSRLYRDFADLRSIGTGTYGTVYSGCCRLDGVVYAIKETRKLVKETGQKAMSNLLREAHALASLQMVNGQATSCPHILRYFSTWIEDQKLFVQMELCSGGSLDRFVNQRIPMSEPQLQEICRQMATALQYIHACSIAHMDLKPDNILETAEGSGVFRLCDFGVCCLISERPDDFEVMDGDSRYLSDELLNDNYDHLDKADIFALGATLLELGLGRKLPQGGFEYREIRMGQSPDLPGLSEKFNGLIRSMLHPDPNARPTASDILFRMFQSGGCNSMQQQRSLDMAMQRLQALEAEVQRLEQQNAKLLSQI